MPLTPEQQQEVAAARGETRPTRRATRALRLHLVNEFASRVGTRRPSFALRERPDDLGQPVGSMLVAGRRRARHGADRIQLLPR